MCRQKYVFFRPGGFYTESIFFQYWGWLNLSHHSRWVNVPKMNRCSQQYFSIINASKVTGIVHSNGFIFSVSRDKSIIKWGLDGTKVKQISNLHGDWIINLKLMPITNYLITNSRDGSVKVSIFYVLKGYPKTGENRRN